MQISVWESNPTEHKNIFQKIIIQNKKIIACKASKVIRVLLYYQSFP